MSEPKIKYEDLGPDHDLIKRATFWGEEGQERLDDTEIDDCIEYIVDGLFGLGDDDPLNTTIEVFAFERMNVGVDPVTQILEPLLESLDEEYCDPNDVYTMPTDEMKSAAAKLAEVVEREYEAWACAEIGTVEVDVMAWVKEHKPDWLEV
jgi:hypothetical protein